MPFELWNWADAAGAPREVMDNWRNRDIRADIQAQVNFPVYLQNDATSACGAELVFGKGGTPRDFIYFYIGAFAGGGIVLNGGLYSGPTGNAGALGSMPVPGPGRRAAPADRHRLDRHARAGAQRQRAATLRFCGPRRRTGASSARSSTTGSPRPPTASPMRSSSASSVIDFQAAVVDGWMPASVRARLVAAVGDALQTIDAEGLAVPPVREGTVGIHARALGGASLPLSDRFLVGATAAAIGRLRRVMLIGIPAILGPELLSTLRAMGHGDEIAVVDGNYPALEHARRLIRADGHGVIPIVDAILQVLPVDDFVPEALFRATVRGDLDALDPIHRDMVAVCEKRAPGPQAGAAAGRALLRSRQGGARRRCDQRAEALWQHDHPQGGDLSGCGAAPK